MASDQDLKPGDVVQLKSGSPLMTVASVRDDDVVCSWFEKSKNKKDVFKTIQLIKPGPRRAIRVAF